MREKSEAIRAFVGRLKLERHGWVVVDYWEADLSAIGIARRDEPRRLVYVSTFNKPPGIYDFECESPSDAETADFRTVTRGNNVNYDQLFGAISLHLGQGLLGSLDG